jgi:GNAT superfamily N-acetyltransferase
VTMAGRLTRIESLAKGEVAAAITGAPPLDEATLSRDAPEETWVLHDSRGLPAAHGSIWWRETPPLGGRRPGVIGHYAASDAETAGRLLERLSTRLAAEGCLVAVGPMDGTTWRKYRFVVDKGREPAFFLDVDNPDEWPEHFRRGGFAPVAEYFSTRVEDMSSQDPRVTRVSERLTGLGVRIRSLDPARMDEELRAIHALSAVSFRDAFMYSPISEEAFMSLYRPLLPRVDPRLVLMAEHEGRLAGYVFAVPDLNEAARGARVRTLIVKTLAVLPDRKYAGLGALLLARVHHNGLDIGLDRAIHALMFASNVSRALSGHWNGRQIRRYELFAKELSS